MSGGYPAGVSDADFDMPDTDRWRCTQIAMGGDDECREPLPPLEGADGQGFPGPCPKCSPQSYPAQCFRCGRGTGREVGGFYNTNTTVGTKIWTCIPCQRDDQRKGMEDAHDSTEGTF